MSTKASRKSFYLNYRRYDIASFDQFEQEGNVLVDDMASTLRAAGYGFTLEHREAEDEQDLSYLPLERWDDRKYRVRD